MKKIIIIGSGVAGLVAGICGQRDGFETVIYEKNAWAGGSCSAWKRNGYVIDNCLHWLTGTRDGTSDKKMWVDYGVLKENEPLIQRESFFACQAGGKIATLWRDISKTRNELKEISPSDAVEIDAFLDCVQFFADLITSGFSARELYRSIKDFNSSLNSNRFEFTKHFVKYLNINSEQIAERFNHPAIQGLFTEFMAKEYESYWLMLAYSFFISGNGDLPEGGSLGMAKNLKEKYESLGGKIIFNMPAKSIIIDKNTKKFKTIEEEILNGKNPKKVVYHHATGVLFENGQIETADYIIPACDIHFTFKNLLNNKYTPSSLKKLYRKPGQSKTEIYSSFHVAFACDGLFECVPDTLSVGSKIINIASEAIERFTIKNYRVYGDYIAPEGHTVLQVSIPQYEKDYKYWHKLYSNKEEYKEAKMEVAQHIQDEIETLYPAYKGKLTILEIWTPYSYARLNNDFLGAYMRYITTPFSFNAFLPSEVFGIDNVILASHCLRYPGGLPTAAYTGRDAIEYIKKLENYIAPVTFIKEKAAVVGEKVSEKAVEVGELVSEKVAAVGEKAGAVTEKVGEKLKKLND